MGVSTMTAKKFRLLHNFNFILLPKKCVFVRTLLFTSNSNNHIYLNKERMKFFKKKGGGGREEEKG